MGDANPPPRPAIVNAGNLRPSSQTSHKSKSGSRAASDDTEAYTSNASARTGQHSMPPDQQYGRQPFDMSTMTTALPSFPSSSNDTQMQSSFQQQYPSVNYPMPSVAQFAGQIVGGHAAYGMQFPQQYQTAFAQSQMSPAQGYGLSINTHPQQHYAHPYYQNAPLQFDPRFGQPQQPRQPQMYGRGPNPAYRQDYSGQRPDVTQERRLPQDPAWPVTAPANDSNSQSTPLTSHASVVARGPPRKPKQSGHALWVGNLPPATLVIDLKDHFSKDATNDIESVFLISRSNCAFVNYKTEVACAAAMARFHDSRFQGVRLVCRLRRANVNAPSGPSAQTQTQSAKQPDTEPLSPGGVESAGEGQTLGSESPTTTKVKEKYFIVKSLTTEDLETSVQNGVWATQAHNELTLNRAYEAAEIVYLIFSANKSGEYFGYARMTSPVSDEPAITTEPSRKSKGPVTDRDLPATTPTPATDTAPKGRIIDDSSRGTIFWEAVDDAEEDAQRDDAASVKSIEEIDEGIEDPDQSFGRPFKIEWLSTDRLPFYRTRGLRNPWNSNREVKIARDGTELEPTVGKKLVQMFHRPFAGSASGRPVPPPQGNMVGGFQPRRQV